jgi:hypothetical protein
MPPIEYVMHPDTEIISVAARFDEKGKRGTTHCVFGEDNIRNLLGRIDWSDTMVIGHNMSGFDAMILAWRFGVNPKMWGCTLSMARPFYQSSVGGSLKKVAAALGVGEKGDLEATNTKGKRYEDFAPEEIEALKEYNKLDVELCAGIFYKLAPNTPAFEMKLIDRTTRMLTEPKFELDMDMLEAALVAEKDEKRLMLLDLASLTGAYSSDMEEDDAAAAVKKVLASAPKFAALLRDLGVEPPTKPSPTNPEKTVFALAKTDEAFLELQDHDDQLVATAARARLGVKSTLLETRVQRFLDTGAAVGGKMPIFLNYYAATTGRWGGSGKLNQQNLPRVSGKPTDALRNSLRAPKGHKVVVVDLSGIELRVNHFLWKVESSTALFNADPEKADLYKDFASKLYGVEVSEVTKSQRQMGKLCVAEGTLLLYKIDGVISLVPIESFDPKGQLWDGEEWVWAQGLVSNGLKQTLPLCGVSLTPDHRVLCGTQWREARCVHGEHLALALATGAGNLRLLDILSGLSSGSLRLLLSATAGLLSTRWRQVTSKLLRPRGATFALRKPQGASDTGSTSVPCQKTTTGHACWTGFPPRSRGAITRAMSHTLTTGAEVYMYAMRGVATARNFFYTFAASTDGTPRSSRWTAPTSTVGTNRETSGSLAAGITILTNEKYGTLKPESGSLKPESGSSKRVYDIVGCGPRSRFTVMSTRGPLVVHNCHLGLGFGSGPTTFVRIAKTMGGVDVPDDEAIKVVRAWRTEYADIRKGWQACNDALVYVWNREYGKEIDPWGMCVVQEGGIKTPVGMIRYPALEYKEADKEFWYGEGRNRSRLHGPKVDENIVQHLARCIMAEQLLTVAAKYDVVHTVHDEVVCIVEESRAQECLDFMLDTMRTPPTWWPELMMWAEGSFGDSYGEAK